MAYVEKKSAFFWHFGESRERTSGHDMNAEAAVMNN